MHSKTFLRLALGSAAIALVLSLGGCQNPASNSTPSAPVASFDSLFADKSLTRALFADAAKAKPLAAMGDYNGTLTVEPTLAGALRATVGTAAASAGWSAGTLAQVSDAALDYGSYFDFTNVKKIKFDVRSSLPLANLAFKVEASDGSAAVAETKISVLDPTVTAVSETAWTPVSVDLSANTKTQIKVAFCFVLGKTAGWAEFRNVAFVDAAGANVSIGSTVSYTAVNAAAPSVVAAKAALKTAITDATALKASKTVGTANGNWTQAGVDTYTAAIAAAQTAYDSSTSTLSALTTAKNTLAAATTAFNKAYVGYVAPSKTNYLFKSSGTADFSKLSFDTWGSGTTLKTDAVDANQGTVITVTAGTGWGGASCVAFTGLTAGVIGDYTKISFKVKLASGTIVKVSLPGYTTQDKEYKTTDAVGTSLGNGWYQMTVPMADHGALSKLADTTQFALIFPADSTGPSVTDVAFVP